MTLWPIIILQRTHMTPALQRKILIRGGMSTFMCSINQLSPQQFTKKPG